MYITLNPLGNPRVQKRDELAALERSAEAHRLYLQSYTVRQIAAKLGVSPTAVCQYLKRGKERFLASIVKAHEARVDEDFGRLSALRDEAWANYRASMIGLEGEDSAGVGDLTALELVRKCEADIRKLFGVDAAAKSEVKVDAGVQFKTAEDMLAEIKASLAKGGGPV